jgi:hypothetical protein
MQFRLHGTRFETESSALKVIIERRRALRNMWKGITKFRCFQGENSHIGAKTPESKIAFFFGFVHVTSSRRGNAP